MSPIATAALAFVVIIAGAAAGMGLRRILPEQHLSGDSKDVIKLATGMVGTMTALVLALLFASTRQSFERTSASVSRMTSDLKQLDRVLADYGPDAAPLRVALRAEVGPLIDSIWQEDAKQPIEVAHESTVLSMLRDLTPKGSAQTSLKNRALRLATDISEIQASMSSQPPDSVSHPFIAVLVIWMVFIFTVFSMSSPANLTLIAVLLLCILSASTAIYLILELGLPFGGLMQVDNYALRNALK